MINGTAFVHGGAPPYVADHGLSAQGPMWYRGTARCNRLIEGDGLNAVLDRIGATQIVIGHTPTSTRRVQQRMHGRVIEIDTGMLKANYQGSGNALIFEGDLVSVANQEGANNLSPIAHSMGVGHKPEVLTDKLLEKILTTGTIDTIKTEGPTWKLVLVNHRGAFGARTNRPDYLGNMDITIGNEWRNTLLDLDEEQLRRNLGDVLDKRHLAALAKRRDDLIKASNL